MSHAVGTQGIKNCRAHVVGSKVKCSSYDCIRLPDGLPVIVLNEPYPVTEFGRKRMFQDVRVLQGKREGLEYSLPIECMVSEALFAHDALWLED